MELSIDAGGVPLDGILDWPGQGREAARGLVVFAHGSGSSRFSQRNRFVADALNQAGLATLLFDLLTTAEYREDLATEQLRFDIGLLADRLTATVDWVAHQPELAALPLGLFGASTGAAAALATAAERPARVAAVVSRGGRPDLAGNALPWVKAPVLLIVGGHDVPVMELNRHAATFLRGEKHIAMVPAAHHLFEEPGALEQVATLARDWFLEKLARRE